MAATWWLFRAVFVRGGSPIGSRESYQITMAGLAATRLSAAGGAGGVALTAWALRRSGMEPRLVACRMVAFMVLLYVDLRGRCADRRDRPRDRLAPGWRIVRITVVPPQSRELCSRSSGRWHFLPETSSGAWRDGRSARGGLLTGWLRAASTGAGSRRQRSAHRDRFDPVPRRRALGRPCMVGL